MQTRHPRTRNRFHQMHRCSQQFDHTYLQVYAVVEMNNLIIKCLIIRYH